MGFTILTVTFGVVSFLIIDRGQPAIVGALSPQELKSIRRAVRTSSMQISFHWLSNGEIAASWHFIRELYTYRISSIEVVDPETVSVFTRTNSYYPGGMRRPDFLARRTGHVWEASPPSPVL